MGSFLDQTARATAARKALSAEEEGEGKEKGVAVAVLVVFAVGQVSVLHILLTQFCVVHFPP